MADYSFDDTALRKRAQQQAATGVVGRLKALGQEMTTQNSYRLLKEFCADNGFDYRSFSFDQRPGMIFPSAEQKDMVSVAGPPYVEFGNCHSRGQNMPYMFGYIAVRHDLDLPHIVLDARANDATPPRGSGIYAKKRSYSSLDADFRGSDSTTPMMWVRAQVEPLDLGQHVDERMRVFGEKGREPEARSFLSGTTLQYFLDMAEHFDVEVVDGWTLLYAYVTEVTGLEADRWAWAFSVASRLLDQVERWTSSHALLPGAPPRDKIERPSFYTSKTFPPPAEIASGPWQPAVGRNAFWDFVWRD